MESVIYRSHNNTDKSSTTGVRGRVECPYGTDVLRKFQSVSAWFNFKLKREQKIAVKSISVNESRLGCLVADRLHMGRVKYYKLYVIASEQRNNTEGFARVYHHHQRPDYQTKITWNQVCVLAIDIYIDDDFSPAKLYQQRISRLHVVMKSQEM